MTKFAQWKAEITPGNVVSWLITFAGVVGLIALLQADVKELRLAGERMDKRVEKVEARADRLNESISEMRGDIRVIRQIVETQAKK